MTVMIKKDDNGRSEQLLRVSQVSQYANAVILYM